MAKIADKILKKRYADGGSVQVDTPQDGGGALQMVLARQRANDANTIQSERTAPLPGEITPESEGLQTPIIAPEDLVGAAIAAPAEAAIRGVGSELAETAPALLADETGSLHLPDKGNAIVRGIADQYREAAGLPEPTTRVLTGADPERGYRLAQAYQEMEHAPNNPKVKNAYDALINETKAQYKAIKDSGLKIERMQPGMDNPYPNGSADMLHDIKNNNHLWFYPTDQGFGSTSVADHPMLADTDEKIGGKTLKANDMFRIVRDYFGHAQEGNQFGPSGEEKAWQLHAPMYSPEARKAMTTETRGQNSWVNFGPHGEFNRANPSKTIYAPQKAGLLPNWAVVEGSPAQLSQKEMALQSSKKGFRGYQAQVAAAHKAARSKYAAGGAVEMNNESPAAQGVPDYSAVPQLTAQTAPEVAQDNEIPKETTQPEPQVSDRVNMITPENEIISLPHNQVADALDAGYSLAPQDRVDEYFRRQKYEQPLEQAKTVGEGIGTGVAGPAFTAAERALGANPEDILARRQINPGEYYGGQAAGFIGSSLAGVGEGRLVGALGEGAVKALGLHGAESLVGRIGSKAVQGAVETALLQAGDEGSRLLAQDPDVGVQSAVTDIGLAGLVGGGCGGGLGLMGAGADAAAHSKLGKLLHLVAAKTGGVENVAPDEIRRAIQVSGLNVPPEIVAGLSRDPEIRHMFAALQESSTGAGLKAQEAMRAFRQRASNAIVTALGRSPEDVVNLENLSAFDAGTAVKKALKAELKAKIDPIAEQFEKVKKQFSNTPIEDADKQDMINQIAQTHDQEGYGLDPQSPQAGLVQRAIKIINNMNTLEDVRKGASIIDDLTKTPELWRVGGQLKSVLRNAEDRILDKNIEREVGPQVNLRGDDYSIITAENPHAQTLPPNENEKLMQKLYADLDSRGVPYMKTTGPYRPDLEHGVLIPHSEKISKDEINWIAKQYGQESAFHRLGRQNQLEFVTGPNAGKMYTGESIRYNPADTENWTEINGKRFHANIDTSKLKTPELVHYSVNPEELQELDPAFQGTGVAGKEAERGAERLPRTYYYESHAIPEDIVAARAKRVYTIARPNNILDLNSSAGNAIQEEAAKAATNETDRVNQMERLIQAHGYDGYKNTASQLPEAVALFTKQPVLSSAEMDAEQYAKIRAKQAAAEALSRAKQTAKEQIHHHIKDQIKDTIAGDTVQSDTGVQHKAARVAYRQAMQRIEALNDRLHVGRYNGPKSFMSALDDMAPEDVLRRLSPRSDAGLISELQDNFPQTTEHVRNYYLDQLLKNASLRAAPGEAVNAKNFYNSLQKLSPEMKQFMMPPEASNRLDSIQQILEGLPTKMNTSGTAKTLDALWGDIPSTALGLATALADHSAITGLAVKAVTQALDRDVPDAARLSLLKFLGSDKPIDSAAFKTTVDTVQSMLDGAKRVNKSVTNLFRPGVDVIPESQMPTEKDRVKLEKAVKSYQATPNMLMHIGAKHAYYLPAHGQSMAATAASAMNFLSSQRPSTDTQAPLDTQRAPSSIQKAYYNRILDIAQQPLVVLNKMKQNRLTPQDVGAFKAMYPALYTSIAQKLTNEIMEQKSKGKTIPYNLRLQISTYLGQPLDSTMLPASVISIQSMSQAQKQAAQNAGGVRKSSAKLENISKNAMTAGQMRESVRAGHQKP